MTTLRRNPNLIQPRPPCATNSWMLPWRCRGRQLKRSAAVSHGRPVVTTRGRPGPAHFLLWEGRSAFKAVTWNALRLGEGSTRAEAAPGPVGPPRRISLRGALPPTRGHVRPCPASPTYLGEGSLSPRSFARIGVAPTRSANRTSFRGECREPPPARARPRNDSRPRRESMRSPYGHASQVLQLSSTGSRRQSLMLIARPARPLRSAPFACDARGDLTGQGNQALHNQRFVASASLAHSRSMPRIECEPRMIVLIVIQLLKEGSCDEVPTSNCPSACRVVRAL